LGFTKRTHAQVVPHCRAHAYFMHRAILSEIGIDMSRFATDANLISWACICPRNDESAGKRRSNHSQRLALALDHRLLWPALARRLSSDWPKERPNMCRSANSGSTIWADVAS
jgi:transposase